MRISAPQKIYHPLIACTAQKWHLSDPNGADPTALTCPHPKSIFMQYVPKLGGEGRAFRRKEAEPESRGQHILFFSLTFISTYNKSYRKVFTHFHHNGYHIGRKHLPWIFLRDFEVRMMQNIAKICKLLCCGQHAHWRGGIEPLPLTYIFSRWPEKGSQPKNGAWLHLREFYGTSTGERVFRIG